MTVPTVSVIIPFLNQPEYLTNCLRSLQAQRIGMAGVQVIVVDNGSKQLPTEICAGYPNVKLTSEETPGPGPARNRGIKVADSSILAFIDADCIADPDWLTAILDAFTDPTTQVIGGDVRIALSDPAHMTSLEAYESVYAYRQKEYIEKKGFSGTGNLAMRRQVHEDVGPFAGIGVAEDREWGQRATLKGYKIRFVPQMIVFHPARKSMDELKTKWDRHTAHDFAEQVKAPSDRLRWLAKSIALSISPIGEVVRIALSDRLTKPRERLFAFGALFVIRQHRAKVAFLELFASKDARSTRMWNRE